MKPSKDNFMDSKTVLAIAISVVFFIGWQFYLTKKYPDMHKVTSIQVATETDKGLNSINENNNAEKSNTSNKNILKIEEAKVQIQKEQVIPYKSKELSFDLSSYGMGLSNIKLLNYKNNNEPIAIAHSESEKLFDFKLLALDEPVQFQISEPTPGTFVGEAFIKGMKIHREIKYEKANNSFTNTIQITNPIEEIKQGVVIIIPEKIQKDENSSWFFPSYQIQDFYVLSSEKSESTHFNNLKENKDITYDIGKLVSVSSQYFTAAMLNKSDILPQIKINTKIESSEAFAKAIYKPQSLNQNLELKQIFYVGAKSIDVLKNVDPEMANVIDFGYFGFLARPLLYLMKFFQSLVGNWGIAIILLTLSVRLVVLPFNVMSIKSSKAMQKVQPKLTLIREKYKDDPLTLNKEMMATMKEHGANPVGGCLPALLQIPIFLALYRVIGSSVELYQAPFFAWIGDLSAHDKFYVLPVLMGITMFVQQKITPTPMDPAQAKVLAFLPIVMALFMFQLPSGLTLYMFVSALFGIIQQYILMRDKIKSA